MTMRAPYKCQQLRKLLPIVLTGMLVICLVVQLVLVEWISTLMAHQHPNRSNDPTKPLRHQLVPEIQTMVRQKLQYATATTRQRVQVMVPPINDNSDWAYAFLLSGVYPEQPLYLGFFYNILVACEILRNSQTKADILLLVQMDARSAFSTLPNNQVSWLQQQQHSLHIHIHYLPTTRRNNFYQAQYQKFQILKYFNNYKRILYLDADVMPLCNLDYIFELSETGKLQENVVLAWWNEPASGGFFLLSPGPGKFETLQQLIASQERLAATTKDFDEVQGWGHVIQQQEEQDEWRATPAWPATDTIEAIRGLHGTKWKWPGVFGDQGLLYYWAKYHLQDVSIINIDTIEHWTTDPAHGDLMIKRVENASTLLLPHSCLPDGMDQKGQYASSLHPMFVNKVPYRDFVHFTSNLKPWIHAHNHTPSAVTTQPTSSTEYWFSILRKLQERFDMGLDLEQHPLLFPSPLGDYPKLTDMIRAGRIRQETK